MPEFACDLGFLRVIEEEKLMFFYWGAFYQMGVLPTGVLSIDVLQK